MTVDKIEPIKIFILTRSRWLAPKALETLMLTLVDKELIIARTKMMIGRRSPIPANSFSPKIDMKKVSVAENIKEARIAVKIGKNIFVYSEKKGIFNKNL